jgi:hypothetical protein
MPNTPEQRAKNAAYARERRKDPAVMAKHIASSTAWQRRNPDKKRVYWLKRSYGINHQEYEAMLAAQGGGCYICQDPEKIGNRRRLQVDHNHETGEVRGLLCYRCNIVEFCNEYIDRFAPQELVA